MVLGNQGPAVALRHRVGDLPRLGAVEQQRGVRQVGEVLHRQIALPDLHPLQEIRRDGILAAIGRFDLIQQGLKGALRLGRADKVAVNIEGVAVLHHPQGAAQSLLQLLLAHQRAAGRQAGAVGQLAVLHGEVVAQDGGDGPLHRRAGRPGLALRGHRAQLHAVKDHRGAGGIADRVDGEGCRGQADRQKGGGICPPGRGKRPQAGNKTAPANPQAQGLVAQLPPHRRGAAAQKQPQLLPGTAGLREPLPALPAGLLAGLIPPLFRGLISIFRACHALFLRVVTNP